MRAPRGGGGGRLKVDTAFRQVKVSVLEFTGKHFPFSVALQPNSDLGRLSAEVSRSHTTSRTPLNKWSARRTGHYLHNTEANTRDNIHGRQGDSNLQSQQSRDTRDRMATRIGLAGT